MNKIVASVGLVALGAASVKAQSSSMTPPPPKWWSLAATVRGFYDDNANTAPEGSGLAPVRTFGFQVSPSVGLNFGNQQTTFSALYVFSYNYYGKSLTSNITNAQNQTIAPQHDSMDHTFTMELDHAFNEHYSTHVSDSFVIGQEPDTLRAGNSLVAFYRVPGNNVVNSGTITLDGQLTPLLGFEVSYNNALYLYDAEELSGPLNRDENYVHLDGRFTVARDTIAVVGGQYGDIFYNGSGPFANTQGITNGTPAIDARNTRSYTGYVGVDHTFNPEFTVSVRGGASYYDYYNDPTGANSVGPYVLASLSYTYAPESTFSLGFQESRIASSLTSTNSVVHDTESSTVYASLVHRIVPGLFGTLRGSYQNSKYNGGGPGIDGQSDEFYEAEVDLEYKFNANFSVHGGYDYDQLSSGVTTAGPRDYQRNRVYIGATASY